MKVKNYIFLTNEGYTFQPNSENIEPDICNCQLIGTSSGENSDEAFENLRNENKHLFDTNFDEIFCFELADKFNETKKIYFLKNSQKD